MDIERPEVRRAWLAALIALAVVSPNIPLPGSLPAIRLEQVAIPFVVAALLVLARRHPETRRLTLIDGAFLAFAVAMTVSIVLAPIIVPRVGWSYRNALELARLFEYWLLYRFALVAAGDEAASSMTLAVLAVAGVVTGAFAIVQFVAPPEFNNTVTAIWATGHNLVGVVRSGREVATTSNANAYGLLAVLLAVGAALALLVRLPRGRLAVTIAILGLAGGIVGIVLSGSRTAAICGGAALVVVVVPVGAYWRLRASWIRTVALGAIFAVASVFLVTGGPRIGIDETAASSSSSFAARFNPSDLPSDTSWELRLAKWRLMVTGSADVKPGAWICGASDPFQPVSGHQPVSDPQATAGGGVNDAAAQRDQTRRTDVATIVRALASDYCHSGKWPQGSVASALAAGGVPAVPSDPATGQPYQVSLRPDGFDVAAHLETANGGAGGSYTFSTSPNLLSDASFEASKATTNWTVNSGSIVAPAADRPAFGSKALSWQLGGSGPYVSQEVVYPFSANATYEGSVWVRSTDGKPINVILTIACTQVDGSRTPVTDGAVTVPADGSWVRLSVPITMPTAEQQVWSVQFAVHPEAKAVNARLELDGASLSEGAYPPSFETLRDVEPSSLVTAVPSLRSSPIVGLGPLDRIDISLDSELVLVLVKFGILGFAAFLALLGAFFLEAGRGLLAARGTGERALAIAALAAVVAVGIFDITSFAYYNYQLMAIFTLLAGAAAAIRFKRDAERRAAA